MVVRSASRILRPVYPSLLSTVIQAIRTNPNPQNESTILASFRIRLRNQTKIIRASAASRLTPRIDTIDMIKQLHKNLILMDHPSGPDPVGGQ